MGAMAQTAGRQEVSLLASAVAGDEIAFRRIIAAHHDDMRKVCMAIADDRAVAEEATQSAWVIAWQRLGDVHDEGHLRPWLVTVAANETRQLIRKRRRRAEIEVVADTTRVPGGVDPATAPIVAQAGADVLVAGSAVFRGGSVSDPAPYGENIRAIRAAAEGTWI